MYNKTLASIGALKRRTRSIPLPNGVGTPRHFRNSFMTVLFMPKVSDKGNPSIFRGVLRPKRKCPLYGKAEMFPSRCGPVVDLLQSSISADIPLNIQDPPHREDSLVVRRPDRSVRSRMHRRPR